MHLLHDPEHDAHHGPLDHPERPERIDAILRHLEQTGRLDALDVVAPDDLPEAQREANRADLQRMHTPAYLDAFADECVAARPWFMSPDTPITPDTDRIARRATALALRAGRIALEDRAFRGFAAIRPPGHHAERDRAMGFCFHNHAAILADYLIHPPAELAADACHRVAILDFDVHHGNGTQHLLQHRADVLFLSLHEDPTRQYPGTGHVDERGVGEGEGFTVNAPLPTGTGDDAFLAALDRDVLPRLAEYAPDALIFSAGFDAHAEDPLGGLHLTTDCYAEMTKRTLSVLPDGANKTPIISLLEGGYDLDALAASLAVHLDVLCDA